MTVFKQIIDRKIPASIVYETENVLAFRDINPQAPVHIILITKKEIENLNYLNEEDKEIYGELLLAIPKIAEIEGIKDTGYRIISNTGRDSHQEVKHLHLHILGGRDLGSKILAD